MSYPSVALNLSERNILFKPKPRYTTAEEERNSFESTSPPRHPVLPESPLYQSYRSSYHQLLDNPLKYFGNVTLPCYSGLDSIPHFSSMESDPTRLSSSVIPYNFECGSPHLSALRGPMPTVVNGSHCSFHPYYYGHLKMTSPHLQGYDPYLFSNFPKPKRIRTAFTPSQLLTLERAFEKNHYVVGTERRQLSQILGLSETQVKVWFQNRRTKHKRQKQDGQSCSQKTDGKDCLDSRETSSEDDEEDESSKAASSTEIDLGSPSTNDQDSTPAVSETENSTPAVSETENSTPAVSETENSTPAVSETENSTPVVSETPVNKAIWNPITLKRTAMNERAE